MSLSVLQRTVALAAVALVAVVAALALARAGNEDDALPGDAQQVPSPTPAGTPRSQARAALPATQSRRPAGASYGTFARRQPSGAPVRGEDLHLGTGGTEVLTEVIDSRMKRPGRQFELTEALAQRLGIEGTQQIRWRFAQP